MNSRVKVLVVYYSRTGNTKTMADAVAVGARRQGAEVDVKHVDHATIYDLVNADAVAFGTPGYWGTMAGMLKCFFEKLYTSGKEEVEGKPAVAFVSANYIGSGRETLEDVERRIEYFKMKRVKRGVVCKGSPDDGAKNACMNLGEALVKAAKSRKAGEA